MHGGQAPWRQFLVKWLGKMTQETEFDKTTAKEKSEWSGGDLMHWGPGGRRYCSWWGRQVAGGDSFQFNWPPQSKTELGVPVEHLGTRVQDLSLHSWLNPQTKKAMNTAELLGFAVWLSLYVKVPEKCADKLWRKRLRRPHSIYLARF